MHHRRRWIAWLGLVVCLVLVAGWAVSLRRGIAYRTDRFGANLYDAGMSVWWNRTPLRTTSGFRVSSVTMHRAFWDLRLPIRLSSPAEIGFVLPLWLPIVVSGNATALAFWFTRRPPAGCCQRCGYDLTGNATGCCPECGNRGEQASAPGPSDDGGAD